MSTPLDELQALLDGVEPAPTAIDGDTLYGSSVGVDQNIRLRGFNTPETEKAWKGQPEQPNSVLALQALQQMLDGGASVSVSDEPDATGTRLMGDVTRADGENAGDFLIRQGLATPTKWSDQGQINQEAAGVIQRGFLPELVSPEEQALQEQRQTGLAPDVGGLTGDGQSARGVFGRAVSRGFDQTVGLGGSALQALGQLLGSDTVADTGQEIADYRELRQQGNAPAVASWDDVHSLGDFGTFALERVGEQATNLALMAGTGGVGGALAKRGAAEVVKELGVSQAGQVLAKRAMLGRMAGAATGGYPLAVGEVQQELNDAGIEAPGTAFLAGIPIAGLDALGFETMLGRFFGEGKKVVARNLLEALAKEVPKAVGVGALTEAPTEYLQELMTVTARAMHDPGYEIFSDENLKRFRDAAIAGGLVGGAMGGAGGGVHSLGYEKPFALTPPPPGAGGVPTLGASDPNAGGPPATTPAELEAAGQGRLPFGPPTQQTHAGTPADTGRAPPDAAAQQENWWQSLPDDLEVDVDVVADNGEAGKATLPAKATALELQQTREAYAALRACLAR